MNPALAAPLWGSRACGAYATGSKRIYRSESGDSAIELEERGTGVRL